MKYLFSLILICLPVFTASAQKFAQADLIIKNVGSGTPYAAIIQKLGKPRRETGIGKLDECTQGRGKTLFYNGFEIDLMGDKNGKNQTVLNMRITSPKWLTDKGVKIGDNYKDVLTKYGKTEHEEGFDESSGGKIILGEKWLVYAMKTNSPGSITFYFKNDRLIRIELKATTC